MARPARNRKLTAREQKDFKDSQKNLGMTFVDLDKKTPNSWKILNGKRAVSEEQFCILKDALGFQNLRFTENEKTSPIGSEVKNIIQKQEISIALLANNPVSFYDAVRGSRSLISTKQEEKHKLNLTNGTKTYTHFIQPAAVFIINRPDSTSSLLTYLRQPKGQAKGRSILWGASFLKDIGRSDPMDRWCEAVGGASKTTSKRLLAGRASILAQILNYKISVPDQHTMFTPLGVITNDLRGTKSKVFTAFVFVSRFDSSESDAELSSRYSADKDNKIVTYPVNSDPATICRDDSDGPVKLLHLDITVWRVLAGKAENLESGGAIWQSGFELARGTTSLLSD